MKNLFCWSVVLFLGLSICVQAGDLTPPGAPGSTMKTLDEASPGTPIAADDLPLTIDQGGLYYFTENISYTTPTQSAITITADNVTIDLRGFTLSGPGKSSGSDCSGIEGTTQSNIQVLNGNVASFRSWGVILGDYSEVRNVDSSFNGFGGVKVGQKSAVMDCRCCGNGGGAVTDAGVGIETDAYSKVFHSVCNDNDGGDEANSYGIFVQSGCHVSGNTASGNTSGTSVDALGCGIYAVDHCLIEDNRAIFNQGNGGSQASYGIRANNSCIVRNNVCNANWRQTAGTPGIGIWANKNNRIEGNECCHNGTHLGENSSGYGIYCHNNNTLVDNSCIDNSASGTGTGNNIRVDSKNLIENNHCAGEASISNSDYGIAVQGDSNVILSNRLHDHNGSDLFFVGGADNNFYAGNLYDGTINDSGSGNTAGTSPAANVNY